MSFGEVIINQIRCGGAKDTGDFASTSDKTGETQSRVARGIFLIISGFVSFVDDNETEVMQGCKQGRAWANYDAWGII